MYYKLAFNNKNKTSPFLLWGVVTVILLLMAQFFSYSGGISTKSGSVVSNIVRFDIVGVTQNTISLYWRTDKSVVPQVFYSDNKKGNFRQLTDVRDTSSSIIERKNHLITLSNLSPNKKYYFRIENNLFFEVKTAPRVDVSSSHPVYGRIIDSGGSPVANAIVMVKFDSAYPLVTISKSDGTFLLSTCCVINAESYLSKSIADDDKVTTEIIDEKGNYLVIKDTYKSVSPFSSPIVQLSGSKTINNLTANKTDDNSQKLVLGATSQPVLDNADTFSIIYPVDSSTIPYGLPLLKGTGIKQKSVLLRINNTQFATTTKVDNDGVWEAQIKGRLQPGKYDLVAESKDALGNKLSKTSSFYVAKSGEQVLGEATGSATLTVTPTLTIIPTSIQPTFTSVPSPPVAGAFNLPIALLTSLSLIVIGIGVILIS